MGVRRVVLILGLLGLSGCLQGPAPPRVFSNAWVTEIHRDAKDRQAREAENDHKGVPLFGKDSNTSVRTDESGHPVLSIGHDQNGVSADVSSGGVLLKRQWSW